MLTANRNQYLIIPLVDTKIKVSAQANYKHQYALKSDRGSMVSERMVFWEFLAKS
jgi:hypothetical protein